MPCVAQWSHWRDVRVNSPERFGGTLAPRRGVGTGRPGNFTASIPSHRMKRRIRCAGWGTRTLHLIHCQRRGRFANHCNSSQPEPTHQAATFPRRLFDSISKPPMPADAKTRRTGHWTTDCSHMNQKTIAQPSVSVVMPVYNEAQTVRGVIANVLAQPCVQELIVVDDCSTDGSWDALQGIAGGDPRLRTFRHVGNQGKGAALRTGIAQATASLLLVQDADFEYDPSDYDALIQPILAGKADVVFGSRFAGAGAHRVLYFWHSVGNKLLTTFSNMLTNINLTDMETGYKVFRREVIQRIRIEEDRFGFEPEITAKVAKAGVRIYEVPISYYGRTYEEGKKITWRDGVRALWCIAKYNVLR